jgi:hypothetical protein
MWCYFYCWWAVVCVVIDQTESFKVSKALQHQTEGENSVLRKSTACNKKGFQGKGAFDVNWKFSTSN